MLDCFYRMTNDNLRIIAVPAIGTGGAGYNAWAVANGMFRYHNRPPLETLY